MLVPSLTLPIHTLAGDLLFHPQSKRPFSCSQLSQITSQSAYVSYIFVLSQFGRSLPAFGAPRLLIKACRERTFVTQGTLVRALIQL